MKYTDSQSLIFFKVVKIDCIFYSKKSWLYIDICEVVDYDMY